MAAPTIEIRTSLQVAEVGVAFSFSPAALNVPTSWSALYLPTGLSINSSTGAITGTPTTEGFWQTVLAATNVDGTDRVILLIPVLPSSAVTLPDPFDLRLDFDTDSLLVLKDGAAAEEGEVLFYAPQGTNRVLSIGIIADGINTDADPEDDGLTLKLGLKERETERLIELAGGTPEKVTLDDDTIVYRIPMRIDPANWQGALLDYENDSGTMIKALAELQLTRGVGSSLYSGTLSDTGIAIEGGITSAITGDLDFTDVDEFATAVPMRLTLTLALAGRVLQTVSLVRTFDLVFSGGAFVISNLSGSTTGQGAEESGKWRATLNLTGLTGDANSVDCDYSITTTDDTTAIYYEWVFDFDGVGGFSGNFSSPGDTVIFFDTLYVSLFDAGDSPIGSATSLGATSFDDFEGFIAALETAWQTASGASDVYEITAESSTAVRIKALSTTSVRGIDIAASSPSPNAADITPGVEGASTTCSVTAVLEQLSDPSTVPLNLTSRQFRIGVPRDIVPDPT